MVATFQQIFESILFETFGLETEVVDFSVVCSGTMNTGSRLVSKEGVYFIKLNEHPTSDFFKSEAENLQFLSEWLPVPKVFGYGKTLGFNYLICEFISESVPDKNTWIQAGRYTGMLHKNHNENFGFDSPNYLVALPQDNQWKSDGIDFLTQNRILPAMGYCLMEEKIPLSLYKSIEELCSRMGRIIPNELPSLLHGDLWTGNVLVNSGHSPVFIDPACYFGLRESELAFSYLFGGFYEEFYHGYLEVFPLEPGFGERVSIYHIHPLLIHIYYFGSSYIPGLERIIKRFS